MNSQNEKKEKLLQQSKYEDDFTIIKKYIEGETAYFTTLVSKHKEKVRNLIYLTTGNSEYVDDIAQEVFITVYRNLSKFRFESQFTTWLYRITVNKCNDNLRKMKIRNIFLPLKESDENIRQEEVPMNNDTSEIIQKAIKKLPEKLRTPLLLKDIDGLSYKEIAETISCEIGTVKSRIFRARENLKDILSPYAKELL
jgi:RNA polymerase sigma-70 factor, ECF subfamily